MIVASLLIALAMTSKTIYMIRHAESKENRRMQGLKNVGRSLRHGEAPALLDVYNGCKFLGMNALGMTNSLVSGNGIDQVCMVSKLTLIEIHSVLVSHFPRR